VEIVTTYDRSALIERAIRNLTTKLGEEFLVVAAGLRALSSGICARRWWPSSRCRWASWRRSW
jgi:hypothetical protein